MNSDSPCPTVVAIAVVRLDDRFLVGVRPPGAPLAGYAEFPGGKVLADELPAAAAVRECREESAIEVEACGELLCTTHQYDHGLLEIHFFDCRPINRAQTPKPPFAWVPRGSQELQIPGSEFSFDGTSPAVE